VTGVPYFEWGGHNQDGRGFAQHRPGGPCQSTTCWSGQRYGLFAVIYKARELDGVVKQEVPQSSHGGARNPRGEYAYTHGDILPGSAIRMDTDARSCHTAILCSHASLSDDFDRHWEYRIELDQRCLNPPGVVPK
jgi:hypothetical protein